MLPKRGLKYRLPKIRIHDLKELGRAKNDSLANVRPSDRQKTMWMINNDIMRVSPMAAIMHDCSCQAVILKVNLEKIVEI